MGNGPRLDHDATIIMRLKTGEWLDKPMTTDYANPNALVSTDWLAAHISAPDIRVVDATWNLPGHSVARVEYSQSHIPGAVFFDIDDIADPKSRLPHMLPSPESFAAKVSELGLGNGVRMIIYDRHGLSSAPRVWWMFRIFGHHDVAVLNGGLRQWMTEERPLSNLPPIPNYRAFFPHFNRLMLCQRDHIEQKDQKFQLVDARPRGRFDGVEKEPRPNLACGHIPGSINLPFTALSHPETGQVLSAQKLKAVFKKAGVDINKPVIASCGSGITACVLAFGLYLLGSEDVAVYDGSWAEWGSGDYPVATRKSPRKTS